MKDELGNKIEVGDILKLYDGYAVMVFTDPNDRHLYGKLLCKPYHSCANIPYALNNGHRYEKIQPTPEQAKIAKRFILNKIHNTGTPPPPLEEKSRLEECLAVMNEILDRETNELSLRN